MSRHEPQNDVMTSEEIALALHSARLIQATPDQFPESVVVFAEIIRRLALNLQAARQASGR